MGHVSMAVINNVIVWEETAAMDEMQLWFMKHGAILGS
jgi:hypothetical protein